jgi:aminoglycoside 2'-N-acetyltransferase I
VIAFDGELAVAHAAIVPRTIAVDGRPFATGYVEGVATAPEHRDRRLGTRVMVEANDVIRSTYELGVLSTARHSFYERTGWERWRGPTYVRVGADDRSRLLRTEDEDDGVMVLRFGPSADIDLTASITCEQREGDDW